MTHLKAFGLIVFVSLAIAASIGAAGAAAKVCSTAGTGASCGAGHGNEFKGQLQFESTSVEFEEGTMKITCAGSVGSGEITESGTGAGKLTSFTFSECKDQSGTKCTVTTPVSETEPATFTVEHTTNTDGVVWLSSITTSWSCLFISCGYLAKPAKFTVEGGETAKITGPKLTEFLESGLCSSMGTMTGSYKVTKPDSLFVT